MTTKKTDDELWADAAVGIAHDIVAAKARFEWSLAQNRARKP